AGDAMTKRKLKSHDYTMAELNTLLGEIDSVFGDEKKKKRVSPETAERRRRLFEIVDEMKPMSVRQVFYQATVRGIIPKDESRGYKPVVADLCRMRESGEMPYEWLEDRGRWIRKPLTFSGVADALDYAARNYRKS